ncbi:MAG: response regulator transcription factor [Actinomycetota bacterium]
MSGTDPISEAGITAQLRGRTNLDVVDEPGATCDVTVASLAPDDTGIALLRQLTRSSGQPVVVLVSELDDNDVLRLAEAGATGVLRRTESTPELLEHAVMRAAEGEATLPPELVGGLLRHVRSLQQHVLGPRGLNITGLSDREISVLSLVADGLDTKAIATELCYSERTIKNVLQDVMRRFGLKNRSHAVAFALRQGLI